MEEITLTIRDGKPVCTSMQIAESFEKEHRNVLQSIRDLINDLERTEDGRRFSLLNFQQRDLQNSRGRTCPAYNITRDGFTLLAMGFSGEKALKFKMAYIEAFNRMEAQLSPRMAAAQVLPEIMRPVIDSKYIQVLRNGYDALIDLVKVCNQIIAEGRGYMLPDGVPYREIPGMVFLGWYDNGKYEISPDAVRGLGFTIPFSAYTTVSHVHLKAAGREQIKFFTIERTYMGALIEPGNSVK